MRYRFSRRNATLHVGFGHDAHASAGQGLARLEVQAKLTALMQQVSRIELAGKPRWAVNIIRCDALPPLWIRPERTGRNTTYSG